PDREAKSIGAEVTYEHDLVGREEVEPTLLAHASRVAQRMHEAGLAGRCVTVKVKYHDFALRTRQLRLPDPIGDATSIFHAARKLLERVPLAGRRVRLTGVSVSELSELSVHGAQGSLFEPDGVDKRQRVESVMADLHARFGDKGLTRAALLDPSPDRPRDRSPDRSPDRPRDRKPDRKSR
ncbi:MAG: DNA polymerase IV, partial [Sandaracinaceae bacterium]|nr:DNA polymerase IV [Sandaracinaceae bacterium]